MRRELPPAPGLPPRPADAAALLREGQRGIAAEVEFPLRRLDAGGPDPALTALLLMQGVEAQLHGALLDPPPGRTPTEVIGTVETLCLRSLAPDPCPLPP